MDWKDQMEKNVRTFVPLGYVTAVLLLIVGVIMFVNPLGSMSALLWCLVAGLFLAGCFRISHYAQAPLWLRQGFGPAMGTIDIVCSIMLGIAAGQNPDATDAVFAVMVSMLLGFYLMIAGINSIAGSSAVRRIGGSSGWLVAAGVIDIIASIGLLAVPAVGAYFLVFAIGIGCIAGSINLFAATTDNKNRAKAFRDYSNKDGSPFDPNDDSFTTWWLG